MRCRCYKAGWTADDRTILLEERELTASERLFMDKFEDILLCLCKGRFCDGRRIHVYDAFTEAWTDDYVLPWVSGYNQ